MIIDTHTHYDDEAFNEDREDILAGLSSHGIGIVVNIGVDRPTSQAALDLSKQYDNIYAVIGFHPSEVWKMTDDDEAWIRDIAMEQSIKKIRSASQTNDEITNKVVAIGEIGLDYHWAKDDDEKKDQAKWFRRQINLAKEVSLPIVVHSRDAAADTMNIIKEEKAYECGGVIHCYSYSPEQAKEYVDMGFYLGIGGVVTFKNSKKLKETVIQTDMSHLVLETDCPYLSPEPYRGKRNDSCNLKYVIREIAELKNISEEEVIAITEENARKLYSIYETLRNTPKTP